MLGDHPPRKVLSLKLYLGTILPRKSLGTVLPGKSLELYLGTILPGKFLVASPITGPPALSTALLSPSLEELRRATEGGETEED